MNETNTGNIPLSGTLSIQAEKERIFDGRPSALIIPLDQLCDDDCIAILNKD